MGMSSFSRLLDAPVDTIKIDRRFTEEISMADSDAPLLRSIIALGRNLKVGLIAEGVESEKQVRGLRKLGCDAAQGYYFARPEPLDRAETMIVQ
jgi:EAL domain-containing protein (putative c-di-GMP-specific phosphodiesterase class I)